MGFVIFGIGYFFVFFRISIGVLGVFEGYCFDVEFYVLWYGYY